MGGPSARGEPGEGMNRRPAEKILGERGKRALWGAVFALCFGSGLAGGIVLRGVVGPAESGDVDSAGTKAETDRPLSVSKNEAVSPVRAPPAVVEEVFQEGVDVLSAGRYGDALEIFGRVAELDPTDPRPHHGMGKVYTELSLLDRAEESFRRAVEIDPRFVASERELVKLLYDAGRHDDAVAILRRLEKRRPDDPFVWAELALNALRTGDPRRAIDLLERYRRATDDDAWANAHLGRAYEEAGDPGRAEEAYRDAIAGNPYLAIAHYWLGQLLVAQGRDGEAKEPLQTYRRLREIETSSHQLKMRLLRDPEDVPALVHLARAELFLGKPDEALRLLERARRIAPADRKLAELHAKVAAQIERRRSGKGE